MATREFTDKAARRWTVWAVHPSTAGSGRRASVHADYAEGWLTCETAGEKRRIAPIPANWESLADDVLASLCERGLLVTPAQRVRRAVAGPIAQSEPSTS